MTVIEDENRRQVDPFHSLGDFHANRSTFTGEESGKDMTPVVESWSLWIETQQVMELESKGETDERNAPTV